MAVTSHAPDHVVAREKPTPQNYVVFVALFVAAVASAMANGIVSTTLGQPSFLEYFDFLTLTGAKTSLIGATLGVFYAGSLFGLHAQNYIADRYGRRKALMVGLATTIFGTALVAGSVHIAMFLVFRFVVGFGASQLVAIVVVMMSELAPPHYRGLMVGVFAWGLGIGYGGCSWLGVAFYFVSGNGAQWRVPYALTAVPALLTVLLLPWIPESPRWLIMADRTDEAAAIIRKLHGSQRDAEHERFASLEFEQMKTQIAFERRNHVTWLEFLTSKRYARRVWTAALVFMAAQSGGVLVVINYSAAITKSLGFGTVAQLCFTAAYLSCGFFSNILGSFIVDRAGRVRLIVIGTVNQAIIIAILMALIAKFGGGANKAANRASVAVIFVYFLNYGIAVEGTIYTYTSEIFPSYLRTKGLAWAMTWLYLFTISLTTGGLYAFETIGWRYYIVFITLPLVVIVALAVIAKETKGKTLEEIGALFGDELAVTPLDVQLESDKAVVTESVHLEKLDESSPTQITAVV